LVFVSEKMSVDVFEAIDYITDWILDLNRNK